MKKILIFILLISNCFVANAQFNGGIGDGFAGSPIYSQSFINVYTGGQSDGFSTAFYNQVFTPLPIKIIYFNAKKEGDFAKLEWKTSTEINASHFEVESSLDAKFFEQIGRVKANKSEKYEYKDNSLFTAQHALLFYRLKLVDLDGKFTYSKIIYLQNIENEAIVGNFYPNPTENEISEIDIISPEQSEWTITQINVLGKILKTEKRLLGKGKNTLKIKLKGVGLHFISFENKSSNFSRRVSNKH